MTARPNEQRAHDELARAKAPAPNIPDTAAPRFSPRRRDGRSQRPRDCKTTREHTCISQQLNRAERERRRSERGERERRDSAREPRRPPAPPPLRVTRKIDDGCAKARDERASAHPKRKENENRHHQTAPPQQVPAVAARRVPNPPTPNNHAPRPSQFKFIKSHMPSYRRRRFSIPPPSIDAARRTARPPPPSEVRTPAPEMHECEHKLPRCPPRRAMRDAMMNAVCELSLVVGLRSEPVDSAPTSDYTSHEA